MPSQFGQPRHYCSYGKKVLPDSLDSNARSTSQYLSIRLSTHTAVTYSSILLDLSFAPIPESRRVARASVFLQSSGIGNVLSQGPEPSPRDNYFSSVPWQRGFGVGKLTPGMISLRGDIWREPCEELGIRSMDG